MLPLWRDSGKPIVTPRDSRCPIRYQIGHVLGILCRRFQW